MAKIAEGFHSLKWQKWLSKADLQEFSIRIVEKTISMIF